jgi:Transposase
MEQLTLGIDVACRAAHQASLADETGRFIWSGRRFRTTVEDLQELWAAIPATATLTVVMEPTRNAWVPLAAEKRLAAPPQPGPRQLSPRPQSP